MFTVTEEPRRLNFVELRNKDTKDFFSTRGRAPATESPVSRSRQSLRFGGEQELERAGPATPEPLRQRLNNRFSSEIQNSLEETVRTLEQARQR